ncbi:MAG: hypothetical protein SOH58_00390 [Olsenella sp.]|jgi:hypothetical protein
MDNYSTRATAAAVNSLVKHGNKSLAEQDWDAAADNFARALEADPSSAQAHLQMYLASRHLMSLEELPAIADKIIEVTPAERTPLADVLRIQEELEAEAAERAAAQAADPEQAGADSDEGAAADEGAVDGAAADEGAGSDEDLGSTPPSGGDAAPSATEGGPAQGPAASATTDTAPEAGDAQAASDAASADKDGAPAADENHAPASDAAAAAEEDGSPEPAADVPASGAAPADEAPAEPGAPDPAEPAAATEPAPDSAALRAEARAALADPAAAGVRAPYDQRVSNLAAARAAFEDAFDDEDWASALQLAPLDLKRHMERARADAEGRFSQAQAQEQVLLDQMCQVAARRVPKVGLATSAAEGSCADALAEFERMKGEEHEKVRGKYSFLKGNLHTASASLWIGVVLVVLGAVMLVLTLLPHEGTVVAAAPAAFPEVFAPIAVVLVAVGVVVLLLRLMLVRANREGMGAHAEEKASVSSDLARTSEELNRLVAAVRARELNLRNLPLDAPEDDFDAACAELADSVLDLTGSASPVSSSPAREHQDDAVTR